MRDEELGALQARIDELEAEVRRLRPHDGRLTRRHVLTGAALAGAGALVGLGTSAGPARAAASDPVLLGAVNDAAGTTTTITSAGAATGTLTVSNDTGSAIVATKTAGTNGAAVDADSSGTNASAIAATGDGTTPILTATASGSGDAVVANAQTGSTGHAVNAQVTDTASVASVVEVGHSGRGGGVHIVLAQGANARDALDAITFGTGRALYARVANASNNTGAVVAQHDGAGYGIIARAGTGVGGYFAGPRANLRLAPATAGSHPAVGVVGDVFVDRSARLWFCKGGTAWVQLA